MAKITATTPNPVPDAEKGIPMWGELSGYKTISYGSELGSLTLYRALARVDVFMYKLPIPGNGVPDTDWDAAVAANDLSDFNLGNFKIEKVSIYNAPSEFRLAPIISNFDFTDENNSTPSLPIVNSGRKLVSQSTITPHSDGSGVGVVRGLYMGEADVPGTQNGTQGTYGDANHETRPCIIVKGKFKPNGASSVFNLPSSFYRIDFVSINNNIKELHNILRNFNYQVIITSVSGPGKPNADEALKSINEDMTVVVKTWNEASLSNTVIDGQYSLKVTPYHFEIDKWGRTNEPIVVETNVPVNNGVSWSASVQPMTIIGGVAPTWLRLAGGAPIVSGVSGDELLFNVDPMPADASATSTRSAKIRIEAGKMKNDIIVTQTGADGEHLLRISQAEFTFPGRVWNETAQSWEAPAPQTLNVEWGPHAYDYDMALESYVGGGVLGFTPPASSNNPDVSIAPSMIAPDDPHVVTNPFYERSSMLTLTSWNANHTESISKQVLVKQIFYSLTIQELYTFSLNDAVRTFDYDYFKNGRTYYYVIKANTAWVATIEGDDPSAIARVWPDNQPGTVGGQDFAFTVAANAAPGAKATIVFRSPNNLFEPQRIEVVAQPELPNSYMVNTGGSVEIPVAKPYHVWKYDRDLKNLHPNGDLPTGTLTAKLLWQDEPGLITNVTNPTGSQGTFSVTTNSEGKIGNACIAFLINGTIYWSWNIWVTPAGYDPVASQKTYNGYTLMDRNLGARNAIVSDLGSFGSYYQIGRKDIALSWVSRSSVYDASGQLTSIDTTNGPYAPAGINLANAIHNPMTFYRSNYGNISWYSAEAVGRRQDMWGSQVQKGEYDPCPQGWRIMDGAFLYTLGIIPANGNFTDGSGNTLLYLPDDSGSIDGSGSGLYRGNGIYGLWNFSWGEWTGGMGIRGGQRIFGSIGPSSTYAATIRCMKYQ